MTIRACVDIASNCKGQEFIVKHIECFITHKPITVVSGMGLFQSYLETIPPMKAIIALLATVNCIPENIRILD
jgi:hypothetical protein